MLLGWHRSADLHVVDDAEDDYGNALIDIDCAMKRPFCIEYKVERTQNNRFTHLCKLAHCVHQVIEFDWPTPSSQGTTVHGQFQTPLFHL